MKKDTVASRHVITQLVIFERRVEFSEELKLFAMLNNLEGCFCHYLLRSDGDGNG